jgi:hypothetical protein
MCMYVSNTQLFALILSCVFIPKYSGKWQGKFLQNSVLPLRLTQNMNNNIYNISFPFTDNLNNK